MRNPLDAVAKKQTAKAFHQTRSESMDSPEVGSFLTYFINLSERGHDLYADVRNAYDATVFEIFGDDIFEDGFMKHERDLDGLKSYLVDLGIMHPKQALIMG